jgi:hypothetical protein
MLPFRLNALAEMGLAGAVSKAVMGALENGTVNYEMMEKKLYISDGSGHLFPRSGWCHQNLFP